MCFSVATASAPSVDVLVPMFRCEMVRVRIGRHLRRVHREKRLRDMARSVNETVSSDSKWPVPTRYSSASRFKRDLPRKIRF